MRTKHLELGHEFDVWHLSKSLMKKLKTLEKKNNLMYTYGKRALIIIYGGHHKRVKDVLTN